jgi:hypothetical protein
LTFCRFTVPVLVTVTLNVTALPAAADELLVRVLLILNPQIAVEICVKIDEMSVTEPGK